MVDKISSDLSTMCIINTEDRCIIDTINNIEKIIITPTQKYQTFQIINTGWHHKLLSGRFINTVLHINTSDDPELREFSFRIIRANMDVVININLAGIKSSYDIPIVFIQYGLSDFQDPSSEHCAVMKLNTNNVRITPYVQ